MQMKPLFPIIPAKATACDCNLGCQALRIVSIFKAILRTLFDFIRGYLMPPFVSSTTSLSCHLVN